MSTRILLDASGIKRDLGGQIMDIVARPVPLFAFTDAGDPPPHPDIGSAARQIARHKNIRQIDTLEFKEIIARVSCSIHITHSGSWQSVLAVGSA
jgi:hypothetical protein